MRESNPYCQRQEARRNGFSIKTESTLSITGTSIPMHVLRISNPIMITASSDSIINTDLNCFLQTTILLHPCAPLREAQYGIQECSSVSEILSSNSRIHLVDKAFGDLPNSPRQYFTVSLPVRNHVLQVLFFNVLKRRFSDVPVYQG
jgi:hypothetical protein